MNGTPGDIFGYIDGQVDDHIANLQALVRQPSISQEDLGVRECASMLKASLDSLGCEETAVVETDGHPVVYGELRTDAPATLLIYLMYDVQPVDPDKWSVPPFEGAIVTLEPFGQVLMARGAKNSKGPLQAFLNAVESILAVRGKLPVNLLFVMEGEEEQGSVHLHQFIAKYSSRLREADAVLFPYAMQEADGRAMIWPGTKGLLYIEAESSGARWGRGPTEYDIHASQKAIVDSPVWRLIHALSTLTAEDGNKILVDGFYDDVRAPQPSELEAVENLAQTFTLEPFRDLWKVDVFREHQDLRELLHQYFFSPTLNIDGIWGGYTGPGSMTVLPHRTTAKLDARLVPNQSPDKILQKIRNHLDHRGYQDIGLRVLSRGEWSQTPPDADIVKAVVRGLREHGVEPEVWPRNVGFFPAYLFTREPLRSDFCVGGLGHGGRAHSPDEYLVLEGNDKVRGLAGMEKSFVSILYQYDRRGSIEGADQ
jgi:acetylornithine deacetylase/succinyl-diaminopimelate desuccinylase-like protein